MLPLTTAQRQQLQDLVETFDTTVLTGTFRLDPTIYFDGYLSLDNLAQIAALFRTFEDDARTEAPTP